MQFDSLSELVTMGGHGVFVWSVYAIAVLVLSSLALSPIRKSRRFWLEQAMRIKREQVAEEARRSSELTH